MTADPNALTIKCTFSRLSLLHSNPLFLIDTRKYFRNCIRKYQARSSSGSDHFFLRAIQSTHHLLISTTLAPGPNVQELRVLGMVPLPERTLIMTWLYSVVIISLTKQWTIVSQPSVFFSGQNAERRNENEELHAKATHYACFRCKCCTINWSVSLWVGKYRIKNKWWGGS